MRAGLLREYVTVQKYTATRDAYGAETKTWATHVTAWAAIEPLAGREYTEMRMSTAEVTHRIRLRYQAGITPSMRVLFGSRVFDVLSVIDILERTKEVHLMCREVITG